MDNWKATCEVSVDLTQSSELYGSTCKDLDGKISSKSEVKAINKVDLASYKEKLKSISATAYLEVLDCTDVKEEDQEKCSGVISDENPKDWSYILE